MKQLTMTKVLTPLAALAFAFGVQAASVSTDDFESGTLGNVWTYENSDQTVEDASSIMAYGGTGAVASAPSGNNKVPDDFVGETNTKYLNLSTEDGTLIRASNANIPNSGLFVDTDVQFTVTDKSDRPEVGVDDKFIIWLETDTQANPVTTNLCVWARQYDAANPSVVVSNVFALTDSSGSALDITPGSWYRLTVKAVSNANADQSEGLVMPGFQVYLDGELLKAASYVVDGDENTFANTLGSVARNLILDKTFLPAMKVTTAMETLTSVGFSGEGQIDNLAITPDIPGYLPSAQITLDWDDDVIASINIPALGISGATKGYKFTMAPGASFTTVPANITLQSGKGVVGDYDFGWAQTLGAAVTVSGLTVTAGALESASASTLRLNCTALNTVNVKLNFGDSSMRGKGATVSYSVNGGAASTPVTPTAMNRNTTIADCGFGTNVSVIVTFGQGYENYVAQYSAGEGLTPNGPATFMVVSRPSGGEATITITAVAPAATVNGTSYATFAEAVAAAKNTANAVELAGNVTLTEPVVLAAVDTLVIDLKGYTITGAAGEAVFSNAGTLTITDTAQTAGSVVAGSEGTVVANTGTLSLVKGTYAGTFTNSGTFTITADCEFDNNLSDAYEPEAGYQVVETGVDTGVYKLDLITYTITYKKGADEITPTLSPATYTVTNNVTLPTATADTGYTFTGWKDANDTAVANWVAGAKTGNLVLTAQFEQNTYYITLEENGGSTVADPSYTVGTAAFDLPIPTLADNTFLGWTNATLTTAFTNFVPGTTAALGDLTLYAKWEANAAGGQTIEPDQGDTIDNVPAATAQEAEEAVTIVQPSGATYKADSADYQTYFKKTATEKSTGVWTVKAELDPETVVEPATTSAAAIVDGTSETGKVAVPLGLYYKITTMTGLDGTGSSEPQKGWSDGNGIQVNKPGSSQGFIKVQIGADVIE